MRNRRSSFAERYGPWAVVTGASSGIGEEFARALARRGVSVMLVARREARLAALRDEIVSRHGVGALVVCADLAGSAGVDVVTEAAAAHDVGLLVNNAGFGLKGEFGSIPLARQMEMLQLNCGATLALAHQFAARLVARGRGGIVFTSSTAAFQGTPYTAAYAATKGFGLLLAEGLHHELAPRGVDVLALCPGATDTEGPVRSGVDAARVPVKLMAVGPVVAAALDGLARGHALAVPGTVNRLGTFAARLLPRSVASRVAGRIIKRVIGD